MRIQHFAGAVLVTIALFALQAAAAEEPGATREPGEAATIGATATATVKAVDPAKRIVTLQTADGRTVDVKCGQNVRNFDQIAVGDQVKAMAIDQVAVSLDKGAAGAAAPPPSDAVMRVIARAPKGERPGFMIADTVAMSAKIQSVDAAKNTVTLKGEDGKAQTIKVAPDVDLATVEPGDDVVVRATRGLAIVVEKPGDAAAAAAAGAAAGAAGAAAGGSSSAQPAASTEQPKSGAGATDTAPIIEGAAAGAVATATATVEAVDSEKRTVTLKGKDGQTKTIQLGKQAVNFNQIKVGDKVRATLAEEVAFAIDKPGAAPEGAADGQMVALAPKGSKPGMIIADVAQITGKIESVDAVKRTVTVSDEGQSKTLKVSPKVDLSSLKAGDDVVVRATQALAIIVEKP